MIDGEDSKCLALLDLLNAEEGLLVISITGIVTVFVLLFTCKFLPFPEMTINPLEEPVECGGTVAKKGLQEIEFREICMQGGKH